MDQRTDNRVQCAGDGEHDGDEVERERECYIELDGAHHALGERDEVRQFLDLVIDERDIRGVHGDVAAHAAHGDANVGGLERGRVVYAVADHADLFAHGLIGADVGELVLGQAVCVYLTDVELRGDGRGGILMVAREQHRLDLKRGETVDHVCTLLANRVGQGEEACEHAVHSGVGDGAALRELGVRRLGGLFGNGDVMFGEKLRVARKDDFFVNAGGDAAPGHHLEVFALFKRLARLLLTVAGDGLAERVLGIALRRGAEAVELVIGEGGQCAVHQDDPRRAVGQRTGFVKGDLIHGGETLERVALTDQKAVPARVADGGHDGGRRGQHERAGAEDDQDRHRADDLTGNYPRQCRGSQRDDNDPCRPAVGKADDFGFARVGGLDKADHAMDGAVLADLDGPGGDGRFLSAGDDACGLRRQVDELFDARAGAGDGQLFKKTAELHDERNLARGEVLADADRRDQRERDEHVCLDVERRDKADDGL